MPNTNHRIACPADLGCDFTSSYRGAEPACIYCGLGICAGCDARLEPSELVEVHYVPGEHAPGGLCAGCLADGDEVDPPEVDQHGNVLVEDDGSEDPLAEWDAETGADSDGVPEEVDGEETVKETTLTDAQMLALLDTMVECRSAA